MGPIDYSIDVQSPFQAALQGYQAGAAIRNDQQQQQQLQQQQLAQQQMQSDLANLVGNRNAGPREYAAMTVKYPQLREHFKQAADMLNSDQQKGDLGFMTQAYASILSGRNDVAEKLIRDRAEAMRNSGAADDDIRKTELWADLIKSSPDQAKHLGGLMMAGVMGPDKFSTTFGALGDESRKAAMAPADLRKANADASTAEFGAAIKGVEAGNAPTATVLKNTKDAEDIKSAVLKRELDKIDAQIKTADSETRRAELQLKRDELAQKLTQTQQGNTTAAQDQLDTITSAISTVDGVMKHRGLEDGTGLGGDYNAWFNGTAAADFRAQVAVLKSQQFLAAAAQMKGMGALSDAEGARLEKAVASLDTAQSAEQFKNQLGVVRATLQKAQAKLAASGKLPTSGGAFVMQHPQFGAVTDGQVNALMKQYPGATREQVLEFLRQSGGK